MQNRRTVVTGRVCCCESSKDNYKNIYRVYITQLGINSGHSAHAFHCDGILGSKQTTFSTAF
uniref:Uncharacterized protein n=1 Tax=Anguilla anguilla TaxID=7936 RepID=A0A0E9PX29_ANGAN